MICKDCIHYKVCNDKNSNYVSCSDYKDKSKIIELPCKVGDTLYRIETDGKLDTHEIIPYEIDNIVICNNEILFKHDAYYGVICDLNSLINGGLYLDYYRVFLTKEEAEQALRESETK